MMLSLLILVLEGGFRRFQLKPHLAACSQQLPGRRIEDRDKALRNGCFKSPRRAWSSSSALLGVVVLGMDTWANVQTT